MSEWEKMKLFSRFDGEVCEGDFTNEELEELLLDGKERPLTVEELKRIYFEEHDDVKTSSLSHHQWSD